jgi:hypothetical protein
MRNSPKSTLRFVLNAGMLHLAIDPLENLPRGRPWMAMGWRSSLPAMTSVRSLVQMTVFLCFSALNNQGF